ncbi:MAG: DUF4234 domain-containing protein [Eubacteriales bacterium]|jgi:hypothetical protein|nr:DUF4234 domain-containing protein [Clostridiales bacterium]
MIKERDFWTFLLLSFITCGIYQIFFWISFANDVNKVCEGDGQYTEDYLTAFFLSIITCGIYGIIWFYRLSKRLNYNAERFGIPVEISSDNILIMMLLGYFVATLSNYLAFYFIINEANDIFSLYNRSY